MRNTWVTRRLRRQLFLMPVTLTEDREAEFEEVPGSEIPDVIDYWALQLAHGNITPEEHAAIATLIQRLFKGQSGINLDAATLE